MNTAKIPKIYFTRLMKRSILAPVPSHARDRNLKKPCRLWQGATDQDGYGVMRCKPDTMGVPSGIVRVHRLARWFYKGPFPMAIEVDHLCRAKRCIEEEHLVDRGPREHGRISNYDRYRTDLHVKVKG